MCEGELAEMFSDPNFRPYNGSAIHLSISTVQCKQLSTGKGDGKGNQMNAYFLVISTYKPASMYKIGSQTVKKNNPALIW